MGGKNQLLAGKHMLSAGRCSSDLGMIEITFMRRSPASPGVLRICRSSIVSAMPNQA
jgi:hypothetical protein